MELNIVLPIDLSAQTKNNERLIAIAKDFNLENSLKAYPKELDWGETGISFICKMYI